MQYETYKLGKLKKNPVRRLYTRAELEAYELPKLREICRAEHIKPPAVEIERHKEELVELLYRYMGTADRTGITAYLSDGCMRLEETFLLSWQRGAGQQGGIEVPARMEIYQYQTSLNDRDCVYTIVSRQGELGAYSFLMNENGRIQAVLTLESVDTVTYRLYLDKDRMSPDIPSGHFHGWSLLCLKTEAVSRAVEIYLGKEQRKSLLSYICIPLPEVWVREVPEAEEPLIIDFGTSYTTAGTCFGPKGFTLDKTHAGKRILFPKAADCEWEQRAACPGCGLCPSVLAVKDCSDGIPEHMTFFFGQEAVREERSRGFLARNSIFYDMKRWVGRYRERIQVTDLEGNTCEAERLFFVRQFLKYVIDQAQQEHRVRYPRLCFTSPVKQKALTLRMYQEALPEYEVMTTDVIDEAAAVAYSFLEQSIWALDYEDGIEKKMLILDCGGGTSDMVSYSYRITNEAITSRLDMHVTYAHGDTNFGGNQLTWRIMQFLKIRLAELLTHAEPASMDQLFPGVLSQIYEKVDAGGTERAYAAFSEVYRSFEDVIPTCFAEYRNQPEHMYLKVRGNYYFLWNLAETVKKKLYCRTGICRITVRQLFADYAFDFSFEDFYLFVRKGNAWEICTRCPELIIEKEEIQLLLKPDIYGFLKNFIEPWYESGSLMDIDRLILSGQSSKIELFREVLKEYVAGRKARAGEETGCARKFLCMDGAAAYQHDRRTGRIRASLSYEPARMPYFLTAEDYEAGGQEKLLLKKGMPMGQVYGWLSRPAGTEKVVFYLKDGMEKEIFCISYQLQQEGRSGTEYGMLLSGYPFLLQDDLDSILNGELRLFIFADNENWGFSILEVEREAGMLYTAQPGFVPFEAGAWETDFFDGRH